MKNAYGSYEEKVLAGFDKGDILILQNELDNSPTIMRMASERGMTIVFNPSPVNEGLHSYPLECVNWFLLNEIEGKALTQETDPQKILTAMQAKYPKASVVLTLGSDGAYCMHNGETVYQPVFPVKAVDTTAAGDSFNAGFGVGLALGKDIESAIRLANAVGAISTTRPGAQAAMPKMADVEALMQAQK